jgi:hypothetical protein
MVIRNMGARSMKANFIKSFFVLCLIGRTILIYAGPTDTDDGKRLNPPLPTPTPLRSDMPKTNQSKPPQPTNGPVSKQAAAFGVSIPVRDLPPPTPGPKQASREINPQNTLPIKTIKRQPPRASGVTVPARVKSKIKSSLVKKHRKIG